MFKFFFAVVSLAFVAQWFSLSDALADSRDFKVFDVRKNIPLTDDEPIFYDYYISIGQNQGVEKGSVLTVYRRVPVMDAYRNLNHEDMQIPVAKLKVIYSERTMSVGRVVKVANREKIPNIDSYKVMTGDRVEFSGLAKDGEAKLFVDEKKHQPEQSRKVASAEPVSTPAPVAAPAVVSAPVATAVAVPSPVIQAKP